HHISNGCEKRPCRSPAQLMPRGRRRCIQQTEVHRGECMPYLIIAHDHPGMDAKREELREAHHAHLAAQGAKLLVSGALFSENGNSVEGGASLLDTEDFDEAVRFEAQDPYAKAGIRARVEIVKWRLRWWVGQFKTEGHHPSRE